jgi:hypothetical protein
VSIWRTLHYVPKDGAEFRSIKTQAHLSGWVGARQAGLWDTAQSDAVAESAVAGVFKLMDEWEEQNTRTGWPDHERDYPGVTHIPIPKAAHRL